MYFQPGMVGRQFGILPSQPPNCGDTAAILRRINPPAKNRGAGRHKP
jgi:hypothetical protein